MLSLLATTVLNAAVAVGCGGGGAPCAVQSCAAPACQMQAMPAAAPTARATTDQAPTGYRSFSYEPATAAAPITMSRSAYQAPTGTYRSTSSGHIPGWNGAGWKTSSR